MVGLLIEIYSGVVLLSILLSWLNLSPENPLARVVHQLTEPALAPIRRVLPAIGGFDFSGLVLLLLLRGLRAILH